MFDGLYFFEWVLMALGVILFVVLVVAFFYQLTLNRSVGALLAFFMVPIAMIGYPSLQSIQISDGKVSLDKKADAVLANPADTTARNELEQQVEKLRSRQFSDPTTLTALSKAEFALGNDQVAKNNLEMALQKDPQLPAAKQLQTKIDNLAHLEPLTAQVKSNPNDEKAKAELNQTLSTVAQQPVANPAALLKVAQAQAALGDHAKAEKNIAIVQKINPKLVMSPPHP
jgi:tetratricopeptide (TPR) repeat protein